MMRPYIEHGHAGPQETAYEGNLRTLKLSIEDASS
jgi:hypothetical protein